MERKGGPFGLWLRMNVALLTLWGIGQCWSLNDEGLALLEFRQRITSDPYGALANWNPDDCNPCKWSGVHCVDGKVQRLHLNGLSLGGTLGPELGKLSHLKSLVLSKNRFSGIIPKELEDLNKLELLDLKENDWTGNIPSGCWNRKLAQYVWYKGLKQQNKADSSVIPMKGTFIKSLTAFTLPLFELEKVSPHEYETTYIDNHLPGSDDPAIDPSVSKIVKSARRKLLDQSTNLAAAPFVGEPGIQFSYLPTTLSSGAFPAVPNGNNNQNQLPATPSSPSSDSLQNASKETNQSSIWKFIIIVLGVIFLVGLLFVLLWALRKRAAKAIKPWKTGISGQLQKAFVTGVPKLNRAELETACEDFSNIISTYDVCTIYKGTLSSGVEIAVASTNVTSSGEWSKNMEMAYRKKIDTLSRINHKNFTNLIGYCDEEEPFTRMMVFEYAPSGSLFEHLHVPEVEHLDWSARMRAIMGTAYCLQYMHHDLNPPVSHSHLSSASIIFTDDFAAKITEVAFGKRLLPSEDQSKKSDLPPHLDPETDVYNFGIVLLEIVSGRLPYTEEQGHIVNWASQYLHDKQKVHQMIDPTLESFKEEELDVICDVIHECIRPDPRHRPPIKDMTCKLREVLRISPEQAVPRLSPLWWAELEILSMEGT